MERQAESLRNLPASDNQSGWPWTTSIQPELYSIRSSWPKVSVVIPSLNQASFLEATLRSVILQHFPNLELIVVDGGSSDNTDETISKYNSWITHYIKEKDEGIYDAMNKGLRIATGDFMYFLGIRDVLNEKSLFNMLKDEHEQDGDILYGDYSVTLDGKTQVQSNPESITLNRLLCYTINHQSLLVKKKVFDKVGEFSTKYQVASDWLFLVLAYMSGFRFRKIDCILCHYDITGKSTTPLLTETETKKILENELQFLKQDYYQARQLIKFQRSRAHSVLESILRLFRK